MPCRISQWLCLVPGCRGFIETPYDQVLAPAN
jgi:hypothetical protein